MKEKGSWEEFKLQVWNIKIGFYPQPNQIGGGDFPVVLHIKYRPNFFSVRSEFFTSLELFLDDRFSIDDTSILDVK